MATEDLSTGEKLNAILARIKAGQTLQTALHDTGLSRWYYYGLDDPTLRAPIIAAAREQCEIRKYKKRQERNAENNFSIISVLVPTQKKDDYKKMCKEMGIDMQRRVSSLITQDLSSYKSGL